MIDITHKITTLREALAGAVITVSSPETIQAIKANTVPKGNVLEASRVAGLLGVKQTANLIPDCHPLPIEHAKVDFEIGEMEVRITLFVDGIPNRSGSGSHARRECCCADDVRHAQADRQRCRDRHHQTGEQEGRKELVAR